MCTTVRTTMIYNCVQLIVTIHEIASQTISIKLDGAICRGSSQILEMSIDGRKKKGYITGRKVAPAEDDPNYNEWEVEDALVKSWLINSMTDQLMSHFV